jgi:heavy metal sensor kinase
MLLKFNKYFNSTRFKTILWYSLIFLLLELVIGVVIYIYIEQTMNRQLDVALTKQAKIIYDLVSESKISLNDFKPDSIYSSQEEFVYDLIFEAVTLNPNNTFIQVTLGGKIIYKTANLLNTEIQISEKTPDEIDLYNFNDKHLSPHTIRSVCLNKNSYNIIVAFPISLINEVLDNLLDLYLIIAPVFLLLSIVGGIILSIKSLSRIDEIIKKTDEITTQNLKEIIEGEQYDDEYGRLVKTMNNMIRRIRNSIEYMNQFSLSASHELKTPLTILRGETELALRSSKTPEQYREILNSNYEEILRLTNIIDRLFYLSKLDHSLIKLNKQQIDLSNFISAMLEPFHSLAESKKIRFLVKCDRSEKLEITADPDFLKQVFINLIDNALKYCNENSEITIECVRYIDNKVLISFTNYGEYIHPETLPKLFERFYRIESSRNRNLGGTGLGLSVVRSIIELHNGEVTAESTTEGKNTFSVIL